jgi:hypothetical protein
MITLTQRSKNPKDGISHHGLIKLLVEHAPHKKGRTWNDVVMEPTVIVEYAVVALRTPREVEAEIPSPRKNIGAP